MVPSPDFIFIYFDDGKVMQINRSSHEKEVFNLLLNGNKINYLSVVEIKHRILETGLT